MRIGEEECRVQHEGGQRPISPATEIFPIKTGPEKGSGPSETSHHVERYSARLGVFGNNSSYKVLLCPTAVSSNNNHHIERHSARPRISEKPSHHLERYAARLGPSEFIH